MVYFRWILLIPFFAVGCSSEKIVDKPGETAVLSSTLAKQKEHLDMPRKRVVTFTPSAVKVLKKIMQEQSVRYLRVGVKQGDSGNLLYDFKFVDEPNPLDDCVDEFQGLTVLVDSDSSLLLIGARIDFEDGENGERGFRFHNPNAEDEI